MCVHQVFYEIPDILSSISDTNPLSFSHCSSDNEIPTMISITKSLSSTINLNLSFLVLILHLSPSIRGCQP